MGERKKIQRVPNVLTRLAHLLGTEVKKQTLKIPQKFGTGYCTGFVFNDHIRMLISDYVLKEDIIVDNRDRNSGRMIFFKLQNIFAKPIMPPAKNQVHKTPSVLIATSRLNTDEVISIHTNIATINIEVDVDYLRGIFQTTERSALLQSLLDNEQPLLFEEIVLPSLQKVVDEMMSTTVDPGFELFYFKIKAEEIVCRLLMEFKKRHSSSIYPLNSQDVLAIYKVKEYMLANLGSPPLINELASKAKMSPSKLKRLFKQVFGDSIFSYYQQFRMQEAARLLKEQKLSVSEVGYQLGFTNLSHFSRVFKEHTGLKPKQYSKSL